MDFKRNRMHCIFAGKMDSKPLSIQSSCLSVAWESIILKTGADPRYSRRRGADFQKKFRKFSRLFLRSTKLIFRALPSH